MNKLVALLAILAVGAIVLSIAKGALNIPRESLLDRPVAGE